MRHLSKLLVILWSLVASSSGIRIARDVCWNGMGFSYNEICCLNCPAGTYVKEPCSRRFERGVCEQCDFGFYTEHDNGLFKCLECSKCHSDREVVEQCSSTRNTRCQCKSGSFCPPDQPCEICKTCRKCKEDEEIVKSCTPLSNTICQKRGSVSATTSTEAVISIVSFIVIVIVIILLFWYWRKSAGVALKWLRGKWKMCRENGSDSVETRDNNHNDDLENGEHESTVLTVGENMIDDEEDKGLGPSLPNTTASSQASLSVFASQSESCHSHSLLQHNTLESEKVRRLVPLNGDDSLRKCFDMFGDIDVTFHKRFFRILGVSDNSIRTVEGSHFLPEDRVYELLKVWREKEGMKADFNTLIQALLKLDQKLSAECIIAKAIDGRHFRYEED
ncbi:hematopoietic death receptor isoform X1 [Silurus asotus]|uniref:Hematopoietic death receptor isoform X1 n=1 Tax=Silurus asotus TaxID=30991 RepID=A0AAD5AKM8_SILAS|nr:hematopoietic death receptor isoform X1 [Silurus asotus]